MDTFISNLHIWAGGLTAHDFYVFGTLAGLACSLIGLTAWVKRHQLKKYTAKLAGHFVTLNLNFWGIVMAVAGYVILYGPNFNTLLPFMVNHGPQITVIATTVYAIAKVLKQFFADRKAGKPLVMPSIDTVVETPVIDKVHDPIPPVSQDLWTKD